MKKKTKTNRTKKAVGLSNWLYFCDPMGDAEQELLDIKRELKHLHRVDIPEIKIAEKPPFDENFDVIFFDWGGMSIGNSLLEHFCEHFIEHAKEHPSRLYVMTSTFTKQAMQDAISYLDRETEKPWNIFLTIEDALPYLQAKI